MNNLTLKLYDNEYWWSGNIDIISMQPYTAKSKFKFDIANNEQWNQVNPVLFSSCGRWVWLENYGTFEFNDGILTVYSEGVINHGEEKSLKAAQLKVCNEFYKPNGKIVDPITISAPQYCTWMELLYGQNQQAVIDYAHRIIDNGMPAGEFIIDDGWQEYYGDWDFNLRKFPEPKKMCDELKSLGFKVVLWIVPYVSPDSDVYRELLAKDCLIKARDGKPYMAEWWDGYSAMLDFTNPDAVEWFKKVYERLHNEYGVDGLKMDGGDARFAPKYPSGKIMATASEHSKLYAAFGDDFLPIKELRACVKNGGKNIVQRVADRRHSWDRQNGLQGLIDTMCLQGMCGYFYSCPDMVGGGHIADVDEGVALGEELYIRYTEVCALMPMWQYSKMFWKDSEKMTRVVKKMTALHTKFSDYFIELAKNASKTGEPVMRSICYEFGVRPDISDEFMIGDKYLVAPVVTPATFKRKVYLPKGKWTSVLDGKTYDGDCEREFDVALEELLYFEKAE